MSNIVEFAKTKNTSLLVAAGKKLDDIYSATSLDYENLILNHMGMLLGIKDCEYRELQQYTTDELLKPDNDKAISKLTVLARQGYGQALQTLGYIKESSDPEMALEYYFQCLDKPDVDQGEINESIGKIMYLNDGFESSEGFKYLKVAADQYNRGFAQAMLAEMYLSGDGTEPDINISYNYCLKAANSGISYSEYALGRDFIFASEYPLEQNIDLGIKYLKSAAEKYHHNALYFLGFLYFDGELVPRNVELAEDYLQKATYGDVPGAFAYLGQLFFERGDYDMALEYLEKARTQYNSLLWAETLVQIYKNGLGCPVNIPKAVSLIEDMMAQSSSNREDIEFAAECYYQGIHVVRDIDKAVRYYFALEDNNPAIKYKIGCIALEGKSTVLSTNDIIRYLEFAGNNGYPDAFSKLAHYFLSNGNSDRALDFFKRGFSAGNADDGVMVGRIFEAGTPSMMKNINEAVNWYKAAANKGSAIAKAELAQIKQTIFGYKRI